MSNGRSRATPRRADGDVQVIFTVLEPTSAAPSRRGVNHAGKKGITAERQCLHAATKLGWLHSTTPQPLQDQAQQVPRERRTAVFLRCRRLHHY
ncbi:hypothetical protein ACP70R_006747 [Stipagrostis hirtigluma subsp. patula]